MTLLYLCWYFINSNGFVYCYHFIKRLFSVVLYIGRHKLIVNLYNLARNSILFYFIYYVGNMKNSIIIFKHFIQKFHYL